MTVFEWANRWGVPLAAVQDLLRTLGVHDDTPPPAEAGASEAAVQARMRLLASREGGRLWRNNVGAGTVAESGSFLRWGLANESKAMNDRIKSSDLIGIKPVLIGPQHVGQTFGRFWSVEAKAENWRYGDTAHERAQLKWIELVNSLGGEAYFTNRG